MTFAEFADTLPGPANRSERRRVRCVESMIRQVELLKGPLDLTREAWPRFLAMLNTATPEDWASFRSAVKRKLPPFPTIFNREA